MALLLWALPLSAHESRPAYLQASEISAGRFEVLWKRPALGDQGLALAPRWPAACRDALPASPQLVPGAIVERRVIDCGPAGLIGQRLGIEGLPATMTDVLVRIEFLDGRVQTNLLKPASPTVVVAGRRPVLEVGSDYFTLGVGHILGGIDHLLFVLGLIFIVRSLRLLIKTITAFTVAHSVTLAAATLGFVHVPQAPVEAVIALSILFLASELARQRRGDAGLTARCPWLVALCFGLLHGFGFAGALAEVGLPQIDIPLALLSFNLGVEAGQLLFVTVVLALLWVGRKAIHARPRWLEAVPAYAIGSIAAFWLIERVSAFA
jgi:hydrogenase/urease accessory protein HupE